MEVAKLIVRAVFSASVMLLPFCELTHNFELAIKMWQMKIVLVHLD